MILQKLYKYAEEKNLVEDPDFELVGVHWLINIGEHGVFLGLIPLGDVIENKKSKGLVKLVPKVSRKHNNSGKDPFFLVDKAKFILGIESFKESSDFSTNKEAFRKQIQEAFEVTQNNALKAVLHFLQDDRQVQLCLDELKKTGIEFSGHEFTFRYNLQFLIEETSIRDYWKEVRAQKADNSNTILCLITGIKGAAVDKHDQLKGIPNTSTSGAPLISFNTDAFESYGMEGNENAPISKLASEQSMVGLRQLLSNKEKKTITIRKEKKETTKEVEVFTNRINISDDTCAVYWLRKENKEFDSYLGFFESDTNASSDGARTLFQSILKGQPPSRLDPNEFYLLVLKGNVGRIAISSYLKESLPSVQEKIIQWFRDLDLEEDYEKRVSKGRKELLRSLIRSIDDDKKIPSRLSLEMFLSVIRGSPLPRGVLNMALERISQEKEPLYSGHLRRLALLKAFLLMKNRQLYSPIIENIHMNSITSDSQEKRQAQQAFQLGKLFKLLTDVQYHAIGNDGAVAKLYGLACSQTRKTFGTLIERHQRVYLKKLNRDKKGLATSRDKRISDLVNSFLTNENQDLLKALPNSLTSEGKALFALGSYREQKELFEIAEENKKKFKTDNNNQLKGN